MKNSIYELNLNNLRKDEDFSVHNKLNPQSQIVEIFSALVSGNDTTKYGKKVDATFDRIKELCSRAHNGDLAAKAEFNSIVRYALEPHLQTQIQLFNFMGTFKEIGYDEQAMVKTYKHESIRSNFQASQGDVSFGTTVWNEYPIVTKTISSGYAVNYREIASGNLDKVSEGLQQVQVDMMNKAMLYVITTLYNGIKNASGVKYFAESAGIAKASVDDIVKKVRRFGRPSLTGDYSVVSQLNSFAGFKADPTDAKNNFLSQAVMEEIRQSGLLTTYNGSPIVETPNQYNLTKMNAAGDNFDTYLPEGLLFVIPQATVAPLQIFKRGGISSMSGNDVVTGTEMTRFDMEIGADLAKGREYEVGLISDTNFEIEQVG
ncbi:hypothetical protein H6F38_13820 [Paenibacillus sp. EKM208P]|nr:hypothetical protein H6F38_13820 [Paenibacillus sp. EKM208P]